MSSDTADCKECKDTRYITHEKHIKIMNRLATNNRRRMEKQPPKAESPIKRIDLEADIAKLQTAHDVFKERADEYEQEADDYKQQAIRSRLDLDSDNRILQGLQLQLKQATLARRHRWHQELEGYIAGRKDHYELTMNEADHYEREAKTKKREAADCKRKAEDIDILLSNKLAQLQKCVVEEPTPLETKPKPCNKCNGAGWNFSRIIWRGFYKKCKTCDGTGTKRL